ARCSCDGCVAALSKSRRRLGPPVSRVRFFSEFCGSRSVSPGMRSAKRRTRGTIHVRAQRGMTEMAIASGWLPLTARTVDDPPDTPAVFELANLVRNVMCIGGSPIRGLRSEITAALGNPGLRSAARYIRFELTGEPAIRAEEILAEYRRTHRGEPPPA